MSKYMIDSHKLAFHPEKVVAWLKKKQIAPIYVEMSPTTACNHKCKFCAMDFMQKNPKLLDAKKTLGFISQMAEAGVKAIMFAGEGEPLLHPNIVDFIKHAKICGIDVSLTTNGSLLTPSISEKILPYLSWVKISMDAGTKDIYNMMHGVSGSAFHSLIVNVSAAIAVRNKNNNKCDIGTQMVLLPENADDVRHFCIASRIMGVDYAVIKPYSQHRKSKNVLDEIADFPLGIDNAQKLSTSKFKVIIRENAIRKTNERPYTVCHAAPFWSYISSSGDVWSCSARIGEFLCGNIYDNTVDEIWPLNRVSIPVNDLCRERCRMDECNRYLQRILNPERHDNFI